MNKKEEPKHLRQGKEFHKKIQDSWHNEAEGDVETEKYLTKSSGKKGRMDIFVKSDETLVGIAEIKNSDWDAMTPTSIKRNVRRQIRQIWAYIESQLELEKHVSPGILFPKRPKNLETMNLIEQLFEEEGIPVVWEDESIEERKARQ